MKPLTLILFVVLGTGALAQEAPQGPPLSAEAFDARTVGRTITYSYQGQPYGVEQYLPGRKVRWAFAAGECKEGDWFQSGEFICFDYHEIGRDLQCWTFFDGAEGLIARFENNPSEAPLISLSETSEPLLCQGPEVGV